MPEPGQTVADGGGAAAAAPWTAADAVRWRARVQAAGGVAPASYRSVMDEKTRISPKQPERWNAATRLRELTHLSPGALDPASLTIHHGTAICSIGQLKTPEAASCDVLLDAVWGGLGLGPSGKILPEDEVTIDYRVGLRRIDALIRLADGREIIRAGEPAQITPSLPVAGAGEQVLATIFMDYHQDGSSAEVLPLLATSAEAKLATTNPDRLPTTVAKLRAGQPVNVVCWGDSVTGGGDIDSNLKFSELLGRRLKQLDPLAVVQTIAVGGSNSRQWLLADYPGTSPHPSLQKDCDFTRIIAAKPDLVVIEFVNDQYFNTDTGKHYRLLLSKLHAIGSEVLLLTPQRNWERDGSMRAADERGLVATLRLVGRDGVGVGIADMAGRWEHLWREGIPFPALLANGFNHPDPRGHRLFYEELCRALGVSP